MARYFIRRVLLLIPTLLAVYTITFVLVRSIPGGPFDADEKASAETIARLNEAAGLNRPLWEQYVIYLGNALRGNLGPSLTTPGRSVMDIIRDFFPVSLQLGLLSIVIAAVIGITLGTISAVRQNTPIDYFATFGAIFGISAPSYVVASLFILLLAVQLGLVPTGGWNGPFSKEAIIPAFALALAPAASLARYTRSSLLDVLRQDYVRTARAKGLNERMTIIKHALRNALIPVATVMGLQFANVITGSFFIETTCNVPGLGRYVVKSVQGRDYTVLFGTLLLFAAIIAVMNLIVDLLYGVLDPRIAYT